MIMILWNSFVDLLIGGLLSLSQIYNGNMGLAILTLSFMIRFALLPLSLKLSYRSILHQVKLKKLQPELERLQKRYKNNPNQLSEETMKLYKLHDVSPVDGKSILGGLLQAPIFMGMFAAIRRGVGSGKRFLWVADLTQPDFFMMLIVTILTYIATALNPNVLGQARNLIMWLPVILTAIFLWRLSAAIGLYWAASNTVGIIQAGILRYKTRHLLQP